MHGFVKGPNFMDATTLGRKVVLFTSRQAVQACESSGVMCRDSRIPDRFQMSTALMRPARTWRL